MYMYIYIIYLYRYKGVSPRHPFAILLIFFVVVAVVFAVPTLSRTSSAITVTLQVPVLQLCGGCVWGGRMPWLGRVTCHVARGTP